jgi:hypothetical protein
MAHDLEEQAMQQRPWQRMGGRKFTIAFTVIWMAFVGLLRGLLDAEAFTYCAGLVLGLYGLANVGQKAADKYTGKKETADVAG